MYRITLAAAAAAAVVLISYANTAKAADTYDNYPVRQRAQMDQLFYAAAQTHNWTGFYVGGNVGYGWGGNVVNTSTFGNMTTDDSLSLGNSTSFGGQLGINYQFAQRWVGGIETDMQWIRGSGGSRINTWCDVPNCGFNGSTTTGAKLDWFGTTRLRLGYLIQDNMMLYGTGGFAYGGLRGTVTESCPFCSWSQDTKQMGFGWAAGAGIEYKFARNWSAKLEGLHVDMTAINQTNSYGGGYTQTNHLGYRGNVIRAGINYHF